MKSKAYAISKKVLCVLLTLTLLSSFGLAEIFAEETEIVFEQSENKNEETFAENGDKEMDEDGIGDEEAEKEAAEADRASAIAANAAISPLTGEGTAVLDPSWNKISVDKPVFASAYYPGKDPYFATDGDTSTAFESALQNMGKGVAAALGTMNERFVIDLMEPRTLAAVTLLVPSGCGDSLEVYAGNDNEFNTRDEIFKGNISSEEETVISVPDTLKGKTYRYVIVEKNDWSTFKISEIGVYSAEAGTAANNVRRVSFEKTTYANNRGGYAGYNFKMNPVTLGAADNYLGDTATGAEVSHYFFVDLGGEYEVPYITLSAGMWRYTNKDAVALKWREARSDFDIIGTNDPAFATSAENDVLLYHYDGEFGGKSTYAADSEFPGAESGMAVFENVNHKNERFRYIGIRRSKAGSTIIRLVLSSINVYAGGTMVENLSVGKTGETLNIGATVTALDNSDRSILATAFDSEGSYLGSKAFAAGLSGTGPTAINQSLSFGAEISYAKLLMVDSLGQFKVRWYDFNAAGNAPDTKEPEHVVSADSKNPNCMMKAEGNNVYLYGNAKSDLLTAIMLKPVAGEENFSFQDLNESNYDTHVIFADSQKVSPGAAYEFSAVLKDSDPVGTYRIKLLYADGTSEEAYEFYYFSADENRAVTEALKAAKAEEVSAIINNPKNAEAFKDCLEDAEKCGENFGERFVLAREIMQEGTFSGKKTEYTDYMQFKDVVHLASALDALIARDDFTKYIADYKTEYLPLLIDANYNAEKFSEIYPLVRKNAKELSTAQDIYNAVKKAIGLSLVYKGSQNDVKTAITDYAEYVGVTPSTITNSDYSAFSIAQYIGKTLSDVSDYAKNGMEAAVKSAISELNSENKKHTSSSVGGGGSKIGKSVIDLPVPTLPEKTPTISFYDLEEYSWAKEAILRLAEKKIILGDGNGNFHPEKEITREEIVKLVTELFEITTDKADMEFADCRVTDWYYPYIMAAKYNRVIKGIEKDRFGVGQAVTRQDLAVILNRAMSFGNYDFEGAASVSFADESAIELYALDSVLSLGMEGIVNGFEDGTFRPQEKTSRAEAAVMIDRVYENYARQQAAKKLAEEE